MLECDTPAAFAAATGGRCIFATAHCGNFEWLSLGRALRFGPSMIIAQDFKNPPLTDIFRAAALPQRAEASSPRKAPCCASSGI